MRRLIALTAAISLTGCSFALTSGPRSVEASSPVYPDCTSTMTWPIVDGVLSGIMLLAAIGAGLDDNPTSGDETGAIVSTALMGVAFGAGAFVGHSRVSKCRDARNQFSAAYPGYSPQYPYPAQYPYPYPYPVQQPYTHPGQQPYPAQPGTSPAQPAPQPYPPPAQPQPGTSPAQPPPQPYPPPAQPGPQPPPAAALGTEGDVCMQSSECAPGLACSGNVCIRPRPPGR